MYNRQNVDEFINKLNKSVIEIRYDFNKLQPQEKQKVIEHIDGVLKMQGISIGIEAILNIKNL